MRVLPHRISLLSLSGRLTLHGRPLPSKDEAVAGLQRLTGQVFGRDVDRWAVWLRRHWRMCYRPRGPERSQ